MMWTLNIPVAFVLSNFTSLHIAAVFFAVESIYIVKCIIGFILVKKGIWIRSIVN